MISVVSSKVVNIFSLLFQKFSTSHALRYSDPDGLRGAWEGTISTNSVPSSSQRSALSCSIL